MSPSAIALESSPEVSLCCTITVLVGCCPTFMKSIISIILQYKEHWPWLCQQKELVWASLGWHFDHLDKRLQNWWKFFIVNFLSLILKFLHYFWTFWTIVNWRWISTVGVPFSCKKTNYLWNLALVGIASFRLPSLYVRSLFVD